MLKCEMYSDSELWIMHQSKCWNTSLTRSISQWIYRLYPQFTEYSDLTTPHNFALHMAYSDDWTRESVSYTDYPPSQVLRLQKISSREPKIVNSWFLIRVTEVSLYILQNGSVSPRGRDSQVGAFRARDPVITREARVRALLVPGGGRLPHGVPGLPPGRILQPRVQGGGQAGARPGVHRHGQQGRSPQRPAEVRHNFISLSWGISPWRTRTV